MSTPCPVHSPWANKANTISSSSRSDDSSEKDNLSNYCLTSSDFIETRVFIRLAKGQVLGCSVVKGPTSYPGIFVRTVKDGGLAYESGLEVGDQIIGVNGISLEPGDIEFNDAIDRIKSCSQMTLTVRKKSGLSLFKQQPYNKHHHFAGQQQVKAIIHSQPSLPLSMVTPNSLDSSDSDIIVYQKW